MHGGVRAVGGVRTKIRAAVKSGAKIVIIPHENYDENFLQSFGVKIIPASDMVDVMKNAFDLQETNGLIALIRPA